ncbi:hypothetical protein F2Q69_00017385 [Brassica cretica]|uniref:Glycosyltransferase 2-like domain-containing protein n=1 Tax=Brassica cretica TaxID=69181 RepID=A0A8S9QQW2_BRACR|nr:hypothetical protein F2Q69_00017385 [Brassica cretica]
MKIPVDSQDKRERQRQRQRNRGKLPFVGSRTGDCSMSPLTSFHRIAHDTFSSFLLSLDGSFLLGSEDVVNTRISLWWEQARAIVVVPFFKFLVALCLIMSVMYFVEVMYMGIVVAYVKLFKRKPEKVYIWEAMENDAECGSKSFPMVLVQIPMYNEKEVCEQSIAAACRISWPSNRIIIQVLDDSTDPASKELVRRECERWSRQGVNITFEIRDNRNGYKAGALREGMKHSYVKQCDYIAIFDADFQPEPDFLHRTVPFLIHNPKLALVQGRWEFGVNITFEIRDNRNGYKAGALREGMKHSYVKQCDYIAIFDADFQPEPDFLHRTVPFLIHNPKLALVQGRWEFGNIPYIELKNPRIRNTISY